MAMNHNFDNSGNIKITIINVNIFEGCRVKQLNRGNNIGISIPPKRKKGRAKMSRARAGGGGIRGSALRKCGGIESISRHEPSNVAKFVVVYIIFSWKILEIPSLKFSDAQY